MYKVLARKYRPKKLSEVIGQEVAVRILQNAIKSGRLHHAILFAGPMGVGKTSLARIVAKSLNCEKGTTIEPCGVCDSCVAIAKGNDIDVMEIDGASNRKVEDAHTLIESVKYPPLKSPNKIYIIDEVHMLTPEAFNALLKTIEEPPSYVKFIFATTEIDKIPETILSRCQILKLNKIPKELIKEKLNTIAQMEGIEIEPESLDMIAFASDGSMRVAEGFFDRCIAYKENNITAEETAKVVGVTSSDTINRYADFIFKQDTQNAVKLIQKLHNEDINFESFTQQVINYMLAKEDVNMEYKTALLNIFYKAFIDIKQKINPLSVLSVASYKSAAVKGLERIENAMEKLSKLNTQQLFDNSNDITELASHKNIIKQKSVKKMDKAEEISVKNDKIDKDVETILNKFGGKIVRIEDVKKS